MVFFGNQEKFLVHPCADLTMQGSVAISSPFMMENVFRQRLGQSSARSVLQRSSGNINTGGGGFVTATARCLFGPPDTLESKNLAKEVELKNAVNFGKRFNFDIVAGEPFPCAKRMKMSPGEDSDEENVNVQTSCVEKRKEESHDVKSEGYVWTGKYTQDHMAMCNQHTVNTSVLGPKRNVVPLLFAPIIMHSNNHPSSFPSSPKSTVNVLQESPESSSSPLPKSESPASTSRVVALSSSPLPAPLSEVSSLDRNRNNKRSSSNNNNNVSVCKKSAKLQSLTQTMRTRTAHAAKVGITRYFAMTRYVRNRYNRKAIKRC